MRARRCCTTVGTATLIATVLIYGCGGIDIGDTCDDVGSTAECVDGAICAVATDKTVCEALCDTRDDCPEGLTCSPVSNSDKKACERPDF